MDLLEQIDNWGRVAPERLAHVSGGWSLTFADLVAGSNVLAAFLGQTIASDGSPVVIVGHKEPELLIGFLGAVKAGHPYVPVDSATPPHRVQQIVQSSRASLVLTPDMIRTHTSPQGTFMGNTRTPPEGTPVGNTLASLEGTPLGNTSTSEGSTLGKDGFTPTGKEGRFSGVDPAERPIYIMFTSGSTGEPKGVVITLACLSSFLTWMLEEHAFAPAEIFLNQAPFGFDLSVMDLYLSLVTGGTLVSISRDQIAQPKLLFEILAASDITTWVSTPSFAQFCLAEPTFRSSMLPHVRRFLFCGETLSASIASQLLERFPAAEIWNTYGPTEATVATTSVRIDQSILSRYTSLPIGYPKPDSRVLVLDDVGRPVSDAARGEIVIAGSNVSPGYLHRKDLTARAFFELDGMPAYRTGDLGHCESGLLFFDGRMDEQVKLHGHRIELGDVEANLRVLPGVLNAAVVHTVAAQHGPETLAAFVILREGPPVKVFEAAQALRRRLAERLPPYMVPRVVRFVDAFPMTANGKVDRRALMQALE